MEKGIDKKAKVIRKNNGKGQVQISEDVVAMIASLAASEVEGVACMSGSIMSKVSVKKITKGVKVEMLGKNVKITLALNMSYGFNIPNVCAKVQDKVKSAVENMTGLVCNDVSIRIIGVK